MEILNTNDPKLKEILEKLIPEFKPEKIFLFGSRANGKAIKTSDYDLFLIVPESNLSKRQRMTKALELLWGNGVSVDIFIYTTKEFDESRSDFNSIPYTVFNEGLELRVG